MFIKPVHFNNEVLPSHYIITRRNEKPLVDADILEYFDAGTSGRDMQEICVETGLIDSALDLNWGSPINL